MSDMQRVIDLLTVGEELFWQPTRIVQPDPWTGHIAIAFWLVKVVRPSTFVELGTHTGNSYSAFCQAIAELRLSARAFAVDTWKGDEHSGQYGEEVFTDVHRFNDSLYANFSTLLRTTFDDARRYFAANSVDLLHIGGTHSYEAVRHDFDCWRDTLSNRGVAVFHDTNVRERDFGVWKVWQELAAQYPSFEFFHSNGLGILGVGVEQEPALRQLFEIGYHSADAAVARRIFSARGETFRWQARVLHDLSRIQALTEDHRRLSESYERASAVASGLQETLRVRDSALQEKKQALLRMEERLREQQEMISKLDHELLQLKGAQEQLQRLEESIKRKNAEAHRRKDMICGIQGMLLRQNFTNRLCIDEKETEIGRLTSALGSLQQERERAHEEARMEQYAACKAVHDMYLMSTSWRLTSPLRLAASVLLRKARHPSPLELKSATCLHREVCNAISRGIDGRGCGY